VARKIAPIHPEAQRVQEIIAELEKGVVPPVAIPEMRALMKKRTARLAADPPAVGRIVNQAIEGVPLRIYYPREPTAASLSPAYVYAHGGGFVVGDLDMVETICRSICATAGIVVVSVDYRLAPEHKFPRGLEDMIAVTRHVARNGASLGIDVTRLGIGGDSAGGNLAAATCQTLHGRDGIALRYQVLVYPVTDLTCSQPSYEDLGTGYPLTKDRMRAYIGLYLGDVAKEAADVRASPLLAKSLAGQPPALVVVAGLDPLVDEGKAYAARLVAYGGEAEVLEIHDHPHGFLGWTREAEAARKTLALIGERLRQRLAG
jgi:acetyl esterase